MITEINDRSLHKAGELNGKTENQGLVDHLHAQFDVSIRDAKSADNARFNPAQKDLPDTVSGADGKLLIPSLWSQSDQTNYPKRFPETYGTGNIWKDWQLAENELNKPERPAPTDLTDEERIQAQRGADLVDIRGRVQPRATMEEKIRASYELRDMFANLSPEQRQRLIDSINPLLKDKGLKIAWVPETRQLAIGGLDRKTGKYVFGPIVFGERKDS